MATNNNLTDFLTDVANSIRTKKGTQALIDPQNFSSEIASIPTGSGPDMTLADATVGDVIIGKKFYAGNDTLKTGTFDYPKLMASLIFYNESATNQPDTVDYVMPSSCQYIPQHMVRSNYNYVNFYFSNAVTKISNYAFYATRNFTFPNFSQLTNLTKIGTYAFYASNKRAFDYQTWPSSLTAIDERCFQESMPDDTTLEIILPKTALTQLGAYAFASTSNRFRVKSVSIPNYNYDTIPGGLFYYMNANCDFTPPAGVTKIGPQINQRGSFNNVTIPATVTSIGSFAFGSISSDAVSNYHMQSFTFLGQTPPNVGIEIIAPQNMQNAGFKIYVPDTAVETYKAVANLSQYVNYIVGLSTHPGFTITYNLTNCTSSNTATTATFGSFYNTTITPDAGYTLDGATVKVLMGNCHREFNYYSRSGANGVIDIASTNTLYPNGIIGDLVIDITAVAQ